MKRTPEINHLISSLESSILIMRRCWKEVKSKELAKDLSLRMRGAREAIDQAKADCPAPTTISEIKRDRDAWKKTAEKYAEKMILARRALSEGD